MATLDPGVQPTQDPNYLNYSHPISPVPANTGYGELFKGVGDIFNTGVTAADYLVKKAIGDDVYDKAKTIQNRYTQFLDSTKTSLTGGNPANASADGTQLEPGQPVNLLDTKDLPIPPGDLENLPKILAGKVGDRRNGALSETEYYRDIDTMAKSLRNRYPGYKDFIDKKFEEATGVNAGNALVKSLLGDINAQMTKTTDQSDKTIAEIRSQGMGFPGAADMIDYVGKTKDFSTADKWLNMNLAQKFTANTAEDRLKQYKADTDLRKLKSIDATTSVLNNTTRQYIDNIEMKFGTYNMTADQVNTKINDSETGRTPPMTSVDALKYGTFMNTVIDTAQKDMIKKMQTRRPDGTSQWSDIGGDGSEQQKMIANALTPLTTIRDRLVAKDTGAAFRTARMTKGMIEDTAGDAVNSSEEGGLGMMLRLDGAFHEIGGTTSAMGQKLLSSNLAAGFDTATRIFIDNQKKKLVVQPGLNGLPSTSTDPAIKPTGEVNTFQSTIDTLRAKKVKDPAAYDEILGTFEHITDPNVPMSVKRSLIQGAFDPSNNNVLKEFPVDGPGVVGRYSVFRKLVSADYAKSILEVSKATHDPSLIENYANWVQRSFGGYLLSNEIHDLNNFQMDPATPISWDNINHQVFLPDAPPNKNIPGYQIARTSVDRLNGGLRSLSETAKALGFDVDTYLVGQMIDAGLDPTKGMTNIPSALMSSIITARQKQSDEEKRKENVRKKYQ